MGQSCCAYLRLNHMMTNQASSMLFFVFQILALTSHTCGSETSKQNINAFFLFGDSLLDAGNNNYINATTSNQANFLPYGETYFKFPTGRFSDGRLISDFIAEYANLPFVPPFLQPDTEYYTGVNFASGGAGALDETCRGLEISLKTQARYFKKVVAWLRHNLGNSDAKALLSNAVYMFSIGANDYFTKFFSHSDVLNSYSHSEYVDMVVGNLTSIIKEIHGRGARKFAFLNAPPLGCLPIARINHSDGEDGSAEEISSLASIHNQTLYKALLKLEKQLKGFQFSLYDVNADIAQMINHPLKYGLKEAKSACCGSGPFRGEFSCGGQRGEKYFELCDKPDEHLFWDSFHLTESSNKQIADRMWGYTKNSYTIGPYTIKDLFKSSDYLCPALSSSLSYKNT